MSRKETIPEMYARISTYTKLSDIQVQCSTMSLGHLGPLIHLAEENRHALFAACLCERFADINRLNQSFLGNGLMSTYYQKSSDYFFSLGLGWEGNRVLQKAYAVNPNVALTPVPTLTPAESQTRSNAPQKIALKQPNRGAFFSVPSEERPEDKEIKITTHNPYAPVFLPQW